MITLIGKWTILTGKKEEAIPVLQQLARQVQDTETGTLIYKVFTPDFNSKSLPAPADGEVVFLEVYENQDAYDKHIAGAAFQDFKKNYSHLFLTDFNCNIYFTLDMLQEEAGFIREAAIC
jgi:quinol monooxygenase YgiN